MRRPLRQHGQALVEFALVLPIFLLLMFGIFDVGRAVFAYNAITNSAREAARLAIVNQTTASIQQRAQDQSPGSAVTTCIVLLKPGLTSSDCAATPVASKCAAPPVVGCVASVEVRTTWAAITPIVGSVIGPLSLTARSEVPVEFVCPNPAVPAWSTSASCPRQP